jgi:hypothetical protein
MKIISSSLLAVFGIFFSATLCAHAVVTPTTGTSGAKHQFFSLTAATEGDIACVQYRLEVPPEWKAAGGLVDRVRLDPLWNIDVEKDEDGWISSITWSGSEAPDYAFARFDLIVSLPKLSGLQQIKIWQTYANGTVVGWVEDRTGEKVAHPAAGLTLTAAEKK